MLRKLLKYDFKFGFKSILGICIGVLTACIIFSALRLFDNNYVHAVNMSLMLITSLVLFVVYIIAFIFIIKNYSKNLFSNRGYFNLTVPAKPSTIVSSKLIIALVWYHIISIVSVIAVGLMAINTYNITSGMPVPINEILNFAKENIFTPVFFKGFILVWIQFIISFLLIFMIFYFAITFGNIEIYGKKPGKVGSFIAAIVIIIAIAYIFNLVEKYIPNATLYFLNDGGFIFQQDMYSQFGFYAQIDIAQFILSIVLFIGLFLGNNYLLKNKISLS